MKRDFINISKKIFVLFIITILFVFFGSCSSLAEKNFSEESRIVNKSKYYEIIKINNLYYYTIFKKMVMFRKEVLISPKGQKYWYKTSLLEFLIRVVQDHLQNGVIIMMLIMIDSLDIFIACMTSMMIWLHMGLKMKLLLKIFLGEKFTKELINLTILFPVQQSHL